MILDFVELCGFRGFREKVRVDFGRGFTVITGRNGVGKSTLCDAVEFAITGAIDKYAVEKSANESLGDYIWWRGANKAPAYFVTVGFAEDDGALFEITRTRESGANRSDAEIEAALCNSPAPENALRQLTRTSIIRDEWIAALSVDLSETERFDLVRSALGAVEGTELIAKAQEVVSAAEVAHSRDEAAYETTRSRLVDQIEQQAQAQAAVQRAGDVAAALATVTSFVTDDSSSDVTKRLASGRQVLASRRIAVGNLGEALQIGREVQAYQDEYNAPEAQGRRVASAAALEDARSIKAKADAAVEAARERLSREEASDAVAASLALLIEHGDKLGLHDEHCPLCAAQRTQPEFAAGLELARARLAALSSQVQQARDELAKAVAAATQPTEALGLAQARVDEDARELERLRARELNEVEFYDRTTLPHRFINDRDGLEAEIAAERNRLIDLERALLVLDASQAVSRLSSIESAITAQRADQDRLSDAVRRSQSAVAAARDILRNAKRVSAEIIDERLAQISPLLNELYQRLRPHSEWRTIDYSIRGDVRRFLSLKVGDGLNPQFVFSSGQRRAAGLAFLLSVYLARNWARFSTLLLDDPVQHIDDFRALQMIEVLGALRLEGRQIVCAVEDVALADLLCRRLVSSAEQAGHRIDVDLGSDGSNILTVTSIPPLPAQVLRSQADLRLASSS